jgi:acyl-CoA hydrolase
MNYSGIHRYGAAFNHSLCGYGIRFAQMKGKSTWQRAEAPHNIAHPDFRDELVREADRMKIWLRANKIA